MFVKSIHTVHFLRGRLDSSNTAQKMAGLKFVCIVASVREGRLGERMIKLLQAQFDAEMAPGGHELEIIGEAQIIFPLWFIGCV